MVAIGALARSFKEAQTLLTPVYFLCMAPSLTARPRRLPADAASTAFIPGVGVTLLARDLIARHASARRRRWRCSRSTRRSTARPRSRSPRGSTTPSGCSSPTRRASASAPGSATSSAARGAATPPTRTTTSRRPPATRSPLFGVALRAPVLRVRSAADAGGSDPGLALSEWVGLRRPDLALRARHAASGSRAVLRVARAVTRRRSRARVLIGLSAWLVVGLARRVDAARRPRRSSRACGAPIAPPDGGRGLAADAAS